MNYKEKAKRYDEALERMKSWAKGEHPECFSEAQKAAEFIFPELKEHWDEGERIRKALYADIRTYIPNERGDKYIAWLERQRDYDRLIEEMKKRKELLSKEKEKATSANDKLSLGGRIAMLQELLAFNICNTTYKVEPKFKVGDWIVTDDSYGNIVRHVDEIISNIIEEIYCVSDEYGLTYNISFDREHKWHKWTINDASDGDILVNGSNIFIFHFINNTRLMGYCHVNMDDGRFYDDLGKNECFCTIDAEVTPATKEQRDLLFEKMKQAGYEWDAEKKELKKIEPKTLNADKVIDALYKYFDEQEGDEE